MTIAVLDYSTAEVDIITAPKDKMTEEEVDEFLFEHCNYNPSNVSFMYHIDGKDLKVNYLTSEDFG